MTARAVPQTANIDDTTVSYAVSTSYALFSTEKSFNVSVRLSGIMAFNTTLSDTSWTLMTRRAGAAIPSRVSPKLESSVSRLFSEVVLTFEFSDDSVSRTSASVAIIAFPASVFSCFFATVKIQFTVAADPVSTSAAVVTATGQAVIVSAVTLNPTAALQMARIGALAEISACIFTTDYDVAPTFADGSYIAGLQVGTSTGKFLRGAVVGNGLAIFIGTGVLMALCCWWIAVQRLKRPGISVATLIVESMENGRVPSIYFPIYVVLAPPTLGFAITLFSVTPSSPENYVVGVATLVICLVYPLCVTHTLATQFSCKIAPSLRTCAATTAQQVCSLRSASQTSDGTETSILPGSGSTEFTSTTTMCGGSL